MVSKTWVLRCTNRDFSLNQALSACRQTVEVPVSPQNTLWGPCGCHFADNYWTIGLSTSTGTSRRKSLVQWSSLWGLKQCVVHMIVITL